MIKKIKYYIIILITPLFWRGTGGEVHAQPQNLVLNPGFEDFTTICTPTFPANAFYPWNSPTTGSPDYFSTCFQPSSQLSVPSNGRGFQYPRAGWDYGGIYCYGQYTTGGIESKEYLQGEFNYSLKDNKIYCVKFYVNLSNASTYNDQFNFFAISKIGMYISDDSIYWGNVGTITLTPQIESPAGIYLTDTLNWMEISGQYIAHGGEKYFTIGNFNFATDTLRVHTSPYANNTTNVSYYFLDDVSVTECGTAYSQTACDSYNWQNQTYTSSGIHTQIVPGVWGDSTLQLNLTIHNSSSSSIVQTACNSYTYNGTTFTATGNYDLVYTNAAGCDSTFTLNLTINNDVSNLVTATACNSYTLNSITYTNSGNYVQHLNCYTGCDSIFTLYLTINNDVSNVVTATACNSYTLNSITYNATGTYTQHLTSYNGCDSTLTINLTINNDAGITAITANGCNGYRLNGIVYNSTGIYTQHLTTLAGCDSAITLTLTIDTSNTAVTISDPTLTAVSNGTYQWLNCSSGFTPIANETNQSYTATSNGDYAVIIMNGACLDTSACFTIYTVGINQMENNDEFIIYPNPATSTLTIETKNSTIESLKIYNVLGEEVMEIPRFTQNDKEIDISGFSKGIYFVEAQTEERIMRKKFIKE